MCCLAEHIENTGDREFCPPPRRNVLWGMARILEIAILLAAVVVLLNSSLKSNQNLIFSNPDETLSARELLFLFFNPKVRFIDTRPTDRYARAHIPGAISIHQDEKSLLYAAIGRIPRDFQAVVYCEYEQCPINRRIQEILSLEGYPPPLIVPKAWETWIGAGLPVESGVDVYGT